MFELMGLKILKYDDTIEALKDELTEAGLAKKKAYIDDKSKENYTTINWKLFERPSSAWTSPFVTGHKYKISWSKVGLDFEDMKL